MIKPRVLLITKSVFYIGIISCDAVSNGDDNLTENYTYNAANMLLTRGANNYTNDANGNTLSGGGRTNTWNSQNRLAQCVYNGTTSQFTCASDGLRHRSVATTGSNTTTTDSVLDGTMMVQEVASTNGGAPSTATYLVGPRGPEYRRDAAGNTKWYSYDGLGSVLGEVDLNGNLTAIRSYDVYGAKRTSGGNQSANHGFVGSLGHPSEDSTGMIYMRARFMDPSVGRFVSEDPARSDQNWYGYVRNNPVTLHDRDGKDASLVFVSFLLGFLFCFGMDCLVGRFGWAALSKNAQIAAILEVAGIGAKLAIDLYAKTLMEGFAMNAGEKIGMGLSGGIGGIVIALCARYAGMLEYQMIAELLDTNPQNHPYGAPDFFGGLY